MLVLLRAALPFLVRGYVNRTLDRIPEYEGQIGDVDLALFRGAYSIENVRLVRTKGKVPVPFFSAPRVEFSVQWGALLDGKLVGEVYLDNPELNFVDSHAKQNKQLSIDNEWLARFKDLFPLRLNRFEIEGGSVHFRNFQAHPPVDIELSKLFLTGTNFSNTRTPVAGTFAQVNARAQIQNEGRLVVKSSLQPGADDPTFDLDGSIEKLSVPKLNSFLKAYGGFDAERGTLNVYTEIVAEKGGVRGYVKPLVQDLSIFRASKDDDEGALTFLWEAVVGLLSEIFENQSRDQLATRVPFDGRIDNPQTNRLETVLGLLHNAFIKGLQRGTDEEIGFGEKEGTPSPATSE